MLIPRVVATPQRTQVGIVGAGPAGLLLAQLLHREGIDAVVLESRSRAYVEARIRAGVLEQGTADLLDAAGVGARMHREGLVHEGLELRFDGEGHRIALTDLTGRHVVVYGQTEVVKDLVAARLDAGAPLLFEAEVEAVQDIDTDAPVIRYRHAGAVHELRCDVVAGCDGFHGVCRSAIPDAVLRTTVCDYPYAWLGILAAVAPSTDELIYAQSERGFALHSLRSPEISRLYLQCEPGEDIDRWSDAQIWEELHLRLRRDDGWELAEGEILEKGVTPMRSFVSEPLRCGRLALAGDAAHIVPPTGAKGLNLAAADVGLLAPALVALVRDGDERALDGYSEAALRRVWRVQHFSSWMTALLHRAPGQDAFAARLQRSQLDYVCSSQAAAMTLAENYVGWEDA
jgi:p-hydroxybenzoate 3-monooxygenase